MKAKSLFIAVSSLLFLPLVGYAQPQMPSAAQMRQSPMIQQAMKSGTKTALRSFWDGRGSNLMLLGLIHDSEMRSTLGISDEKFQEIMGAAAPSNILNNPEVQQLMEEMQGIADPSDPLMQNASEETINKFLDMQERIQSLTMSSLLDAIDNALPPEQKQKMQEAQLAIMGEMPIVSPSIFEALHLTDEQKQAMEEIKKGLESEFEKHLETFADGTVVMANKMFEEIDKQGGLENFFGGDPATVQERMPAIQEKMQAIQKKLLENPEYKKVHTELETAGKAFSTKFQTKMFDVLTDEQWKRLQELTDNPPEFAKMLLKKIKEQRGEAEKAEVWAPGPNSWKPGDPIPAQYRQERNTRSRFPRAEN
jgi:Ni/Co efflux regulator RcnB